MLPTAPGPNPYLRTKVMTASPAELRMMLFDGAIKFLEQGRDGLEAKDHEKAFNGLTRCQNILMELLNGLEPKHAPDLCQKLSGLYTFMYTRLVTACIEHDAEVADEVLELLRYERETWKLLIDQLDEQGGPAVPENVETGSLKLEA